MRARLATALIGIGLLAAGTALPQDFELEFSEQMLNDLVHRLGAPSNSGIYRQTIEIPGVLDECVPLGYLDCPTVVSGSDLGGFLRIPLVRCRGKSGHIVVSPGAEAIPWQWWVTDASFEVQSDGLRFSATVRYHVNKKWFRENRTVPATVTYDSGGQAIRFNVSQFKVPIQVAPSSSTGAQEEVDVGRLMSLAIPVHPPVFSAAKLTGGTKTITSKASLASVSYLPTKRIRIALNVQYY